MGTYQGCTVSHYPICTRSDLRSDHVKRSLQKRSRSLTRGGRVPEVPFVVIWLDKFWYFGKMVAYEWWSLTGGSRTEGSSIE